MAGFLLILADIRWQMISLTSTILIALAWLLMMGGVVYFITYKSKGEIDILKSFTFILSFVFAGTVLIALAMLLA